MSVSDLSRFRADKEAQKAAFGPRKVQPALRVKALAFDQTLGSTGWVILAPGGQVAETGMFKTGPDDRGHLGNLSRSAIQFLAIDALVRRVKPGIIFHEAPPVSRPGMKMKRPESSLLAADAIWHVAALHGIRVEMVGAQRAKKRLTGNGNAEKAQVRAAVLLLEPGLADLRPFNEHVVDAIAIGWTGLEDVE